MSKFDIDEMVDVNIPKDGIKRPYGYNKCGKHKNFQVIMIRGKQHIDKEYSFGDSDTYYDLLGYPKGKEVFIPMVAEEFLIKRYPIMKMYVDLEKHLLDTEAVSMGRMRWLRYVIEKVNKPDTDESLH